MKRVLLAAAVMACAWTALAADVGVSVSVGQPGFYGRIDVSTMPPPRLVYREAMIIEPAPAGVVGQPIYLHVPPGHAKHWRKHCQRYNACGERVYFVQEAWYNDVYVPRYRTMTAPAATPVYAYRGQPGGRVHVVPVTSVRTVLGTPERRCWVERQQVVEQRSDAVNVPGAVAGAVIGGVLGHQVGGGRGQDLATAGGAVAGAAIGANVGRGGTIVHTRDVQRCARSERGARPEYWDVTYSFRGVTHRAQFAAPPGPTITIDDSGRPIG